MFEDNAWTNGAPDTEEASATQGLGGFQVGLKEQTGSAVTVDYNNKPLCGGVCRTASDGFVEINNLGPATYFADVHPPDHCNPDPNAPNRLTTGPGTWAQTTTIDGGLDLMTPVEEGSDGTGAPGEQLWEPPNRRTAYWFGFVCTPMDWPASGPYSGGTGEITGQARNWVEWAPYTTGTYDTPVDNPYVALTDAATDTTVFQGRGDANGNFDIQNVPAGTYNMSIWDEQLNYIMRFKPITVAAGQTVDANDVADNGEAGVGVSRWFGWLDGHVYKDLNNNGQVRRRHGCADREHRHGPALARRFDQGVHVHRRERALRVPDRGRRRARPVVHQRAGLRPLLRLPGPVGARRAHRRGDAILCGRARRPFRPTRACPPTRAAACCTNQLLLEGHRATVDWGKRDYPAGTPGQIVGITYFATTRNEFDARFQAHEDYEPAIPDVDRVPGDSGPGRAAEHGRRRHRQQVRHRPLAAAERQPGSARQRPGRRELVHPELQPDPGLQRSRHHRASSARRSGPNCLEVPLTGQQTKDGAFDGGYAFADYCPNGYDLAADDGTCVGGSDPVPLVAGTYITHAIMPKDAADTRDCNPANTNGFKSVSDAHGDVPGGGAGCLYRLVREEDVNVDLGNQIAPQIPPPPVHRRHARHRPVDADAEEQLLHRRPGHRPSQPLCDKRLVVLQNGQNANADFHLMTNFRTDPNGTDASDTRTGDVAEPGRLVGQVFNDIYFERNPQSPWYGEPRPIANIPVGIYARVDTVCAGGGTNCPTPNVNLPYDPNKWRLLKTVKTGADGSYEAMRAVDRDVQLPDPAGTLPGHVPGGGRRPGDEGSPEPDVRPEPADRHHADGGLAGPDHPARHAGRPDLRNRL